MAISTGINSTSLYFFWLTLRMRDSISVSVTCPLSRCSLSFEASLPRALQVVDGLDEPVLLAVGGLHPEFGLHVGDLEQVLGPAARASDR
jgi:hypothetical protein